MVGSQGTLGFVAEMTLRTVPDPPLRATDLVYFARLTDAGAAVAPLAAAGAAALEIMDAASLRSLDAPPPPFAIGDDTAALLVEFREADGGDLDAAVQRAARALHAFELLRAPEFTTDAPRRERLWKLRKGLFATVGGARPPGTAVIIEDVVVPRERLAEGIADLQRLFVRHGYPGASIVGHARDGNLHFLLAEDFARKATVERYERFMDELADVIVGKYDGALKAEHGSGRNMAPFVRASGASRPMRVMVAIKMLLDPAGTLNPGVILNDDPKVHLKNLKPFPLVADSVDRCIECGFCEPRCPSRYLTLSPRQRIVALREEQRLLAQGAAGAEPLAELRRDFDYEAIATCAGDSMCQLSCPVRIDTGAVMKAVHGRERSAAVRAIGGAAASHMGATLAAARTGLAAGRALKTTAAGAAAVAALSGVPRGIALPRAAAPLPAPVAPRNRRRAVYLPTCLTRTIGALPGETVPPLAESMRVVLDWAGYDVVYPDGVSGLCCGMPFASKALPAAAAGARARTLSALHAASRGGEDPVVTDASPCAATLGTPILDFTAFWARHVLPGRAQTPKARGETIVHPTCSLVKQGGLSDLLAVVAEHSESVFTPAGAECCGFAGDKGFFVPELTAAATRAEAEEVRGRLSATSRLVSTCRTCEIGMSRAVGRPYVSVIDLIREAIGA